MTRPTHAVGRSGGNQAPTQCNHRPAGPVADFGGATVLCLSKSLPYNTIEKLGGGGQLRANHRESSCSATRVGRSRLPNCPNRGSRLVEEGVSHWGMISLKRPYTNWADAPPQAGRGRVQGDLHSQRARRRLPHARAVKEWPFPQPSRCRPRYLPTPNLFGWPDQGWCRAEVPPIDAVFPLL